MGRLETRDYTYFTTVRGMCRTCRRVVPARVFLRDGGVWQESLCPTCECSPALIAGDCEWYLRSTLRAMPDRSPLPGSRPSRDGCPHDCGPCAWHASPCQLPVVSVTNACNLQCPICFTYNRNDRLYFMPVDEMRRTVDAVVDASGAVDLINVTGGEPTLHPQILDVLRCCVRPEIGRVTMNSNGVRLAENPGLCAALADLGVHVILSFNSFDRETCRLMHGRDVLDLKLAALDNLTASGVRMTLLNVMMRGVNEDAVGRILDVMLRNELILSLTVQTMTYTGQGGGAWPERTRVPVDDAARIVCRESRGALALDDFVSRPSAHPLCYLVAYLLWTGGEFVPLTRFLPPERLAGLMADSYLVRLGDPEEVSRDMVADAYAGARTEDLRTLRELVDRMYPAGLQPSASERQSAAESAVRTVYVHAHMDEDTFDCSRAMMCPDLVPVEPGRFIPACTYNLFYRRQDERFYAGT